MHGFNDIVGFIMNEDEPVVSIKLINGILQECNILGTRANLPPEFWLCDCKERAFELFIQDRVPPATRIGINEDVKRVGLPYYDKELLLRFQHGYAVDDPYWIKFEDDEIGTYEQLKQFLGLM